MPTPVTTRSFEQLALESGLISSDTLHALKVRFPADTVSDDRFAPLLVRERLLTAWQADQLLAGKHRGFFLGPYQLKSYLARGGMSTLYVAEHCENGYERALKVLSPVKAEKASYLPRFIREAKLASQLRHDNIVRVYDLMKVSDGRSDIHFMVMELLDGCDLFQKVSQEGPLPIRAAVSLIRQAAIGLSYSHKRGLVHRDVKPGNLFLTQQGVLKVVDLGLAAVVENQDESLTRICNERVLGTADYLAPEQAVDSHRADARADIYALGCTFYFLLTGHPPFDEGSLAQRILAHQNKEPQEIRSLRNDVPEDIANILSAMMVKRRAYRLQTCDELTVQLQAWLKDHAEEREYDRPGVLTVSAEAGEPLVGRALQRIKPAKPRKPTETPTDSIRAADTDTQTVQEKDLAEPFCVSDSTTPMYCQQFESFLEDLDNKTGLQLVMSEESRQHTRRWMSQEIGPAPVDSVVETAKRDSEFVARSKRTVAGLDYSAFGRIALAVVAVVSALTLISLADSSWFLQVSYLLRKCW